MRQPCHLKRFLGLGYLGGLAAGGLAAGGLRLKWGIVGPLKLVLGPAIVGLKVEPLSEFY